MYKPKITCTAPFPPTRNAATSFSPEHNPMTLREGAVVNISWSTSFERVNLFSHHRYEPATWVVNDRTSDESWYAWTVTSRNATHLDEPFVIRAIVAGQVRGEPIVDDFWTVMFGIAKTGPDVFQPSVTTSSASTVSPGTPTTSSGFSRYEFRSPTRSSNIA
ncbi:hypothetical protein EK21DRAFT_83684 [Setomelanomma holmii]|uniref:Uncharacterized protein n=1 Tax=Setomelanomma holmii TaxID=210430 RepID=A0A9P4HM00_9PLEO|nr:hypothetical protein EK21DRAFT_83684 [Setomelanomma holmii]